MRPVIKNIGRAALNKMMMSQHFITPAGCVNYCEVIGTMELRPGEVGYHMKRHIRYVSKEGKS